MKIVKHLLFVPAAFVVLFAVMLLSCVKKDTDNPEPFNGYPQCVGVADTIIDGIYCTDVDHIMNYQGVSCDISGPVAVKPGTSAKFYYYTNIEDATFTWELFGNSMTIVSGQNTSSVVISFGPDFTKGSIKASGENVNMCGAEHEIVKKE